ncbi:MAG: efflux RND transporter periplasmic adaptor subunit [Ignavibacteriae bacterium]|nr:efflux RND transporter periplasmic adaptor subunit [Ignavibacteriota bacterium]
MKLILMIICICLLLTACNSGDDLSDAYGNFEATEITISAEATGKLVQFNIEEGMTFKAGDIIGVIDTTQLYLKKEQLEASKKAISTKFSSVIAQINVLKEQKNNAEKDMKRIEAMFNSKAATQKQFDDIIGSISVINKQINQIETQNGSIINELKSLEAQILQIEDMIRKSVIINPVGGTVLNKYAELYEIAVAGKPLYKIADISTMYLKAYISGDQLGKIKIGQQVKISIDKDKKELKSFHGSISWISSSSEFTPKIIQTKDERVNMVYAIKVKVKNDGQLKIGMPGEVKF